MKFEITHTTYYEYPQPASLGHNMVYQVPGNYDFQQVNKFDCTIQPEPNYLVRRRDFFDNQYIYFSIQKSHQKLSVVVKSQVDTATPSWTNIQPQKTKPWEDVVTWLHTSAAESDIRQFYLESDHVTFIPGIKEYALQSFTPRRPILEAMNDLNLRIFKDFKFTPGFTDITTPLADVFEYKKGVCQDFAHFALACLRSVGLSARYVSGYIETLPPPGKPKLPGADASHAWVALYIPDAGWVEFDVTNNLLVNDKHVRVAVGRDFADIVPLKGIVYSGGGQKMVVSVDVKEIE
jgi:transglutaminase-like putative cysteine protease